ncbi:SDR family oxidoreductase [Pontiellaceae bacterium B12227]|nr:SDR family oxidoreductase [Pontiellaceae bacterium B12227]
MKMMITGASGLLGRACSKVFADLNPITCAWTRACSGDLKLDLTDAEAIRTAVNDIRPELILHTAAERKPDICENQQELTQSLNVDATRTLAEAAEEIGAKLVYISTDYVFDGTNPPYAVDAIPNPLNFYGQTKRAGEEAVLQASGNHVVLRVPILYGEVETLEESPVTTLLNELLNPAAHSIDDWAVRYPTYVGDVAQTLRNWSRTLLNNPESSGIYHMSGAEELTKYDMACAIGDVLHLDHSHLSPDHQPPAGAPRPENSQLDISRIQEETLVVQTAFSTNIQRILTQFLFQT